MQRSISMSGLILTLGTLNLSEPKQIVSPRLAIMTTVQYPTPFNFQLCILKHFKIDCCWLGFGGRKLKSLKFSMTNQLKREEIIVIKAQYLHDWFLLISSVMQLKRNPQNFRYVHFHIIIIVLALLCVYMSEKIEILLKDFCTPCVNFGTHHLSQVLSISIVLHSNVNHFFLL